MEMAKKKIEELSTKCVFISILSMNEIVKESESELFTGDMSERQSFTRTTIRETIVPSSHQRSELSNTISAPLADEIRESGSAVQPLVVWGKSYTYKYQLVYWLYPSDVCITI